jgi:predicted thioredoxin/glutaredoxin
MGAKRFLMLSKELGRMAPVPSIYIDGKLAFDTTPGSDELKKFINGLISG